LAEAIEGLARKSGLTLRPVEIPTPPAGLTQDGSEALGQWIEAVANRLGFESEPVEMFYAEVERLVRSAGPALLRLPGSGEPRFLALLAGEGAVLGSDWVVHRLRSAVIRTALCQTLETPLTMEIEHILDEAGVSGRRRARARAAILHQRLSLARLGDCWLLRLPPGAHLWRQARLANLPHYLFIFLGAHTVQYALWLLSWGMVGRGALQGRLDSGWLLAWALLLLTLVPFRWLTTWVQGRIAVSAGALLKQRLLYGALRFEPDEIRHQGVGQLLGRVIESEAVESLALNGGFLGLVASIELGMALLVLGAGAGGGPHALLLLGWVVLTFFLSWRYLQHRRRWTGARLGLTHELVEQMVGHRTRLAQARREQWHDGEDQALVRYLELSRTLDQTTVQLMAFVSRGWLVLGLLGLAPAFISGHGSPAALAIGLGGVLSAYLALRELAKSLLHLVGAAIAWKHVAPLFQAATRVEASGLPAFSTPGTTRSDASVSDHTDTQPSLDAHELVFRYRDRHEPVLQSCSLRIYAGDQLLLEGPSGGGKSTLTALLTGLRSPESGLLLLQGLDRQTWGTAGWRRRVAAAPQFHENHVLTETFAFNLLMSRRWPPQLTDLQEAEVVCRELGLGELLDRMPAGLLQMVGESGWQLSHGERSRLYIARALLQGADLVVLDESFAALDPENLRQALRCVLDRAPTLLVIAHP
jgi:ATP-binding cassette subfamily B protein